LQPQLLRLQGDKQDLQKQLAAADADKCVLQQQLAEQAQQHAAAKEKLLAELQQQQQLLAAATEREQAAKAESFAAEAQVAAAKHEQQETQRQQAQQLLMQMSFSQQRELELVLQRLQWLCSMYLSPAPELERHRPASTQNSGSSRQAAESANNGGSSSTATAALSKLCNVSCLAGNNADELLSARYEAYQQHKLAATQEQQGASHGCDSGSGPSDVAVQVHASAGMECVQQQLLQLEAGLLQHMLNLQEAVQLLRQNQQEQEQQQQQLQQQRGSQSQRPGTASSRCTESCSVAASCCSGGGSGRSCELTGQLLQAMAKDRKQLAQEVKRLQAQQHQQQHCQQRYLRSSSSSCSSYSCGVDTNPVLFAAERRIDHSVIRHTFAGNEPNDEDMDEVLQLLEGYEVQGCQQERRTPAKLKAAGPPPRELHRRGIGSLRSQMLT
jgi:hypothetical protein